MEIKQRSGRNNQTYFAVNGALATSTNVFTANVDASYYYGIPSITLAYPRTSSTPWSTTRQAGARRIRSC
jgi:hypothetical protein